jgi:hypothetical protein
MIKGQLIVKKDPIKNAQNSQKGQFLGSIIKTSSTVALYIILEVYIIENRKRNCPDLASFYCIFVNKFPRILGG